MAFSNQDLELMNEARNMSSFSPDPSMKCGTVIFNAGMIVGSGWNDMPVGWNGNCRTDEEVWQRPLKYDRVVHGEVNAVLDAGHEAEGAVAYCWPPGLGPACSRCAAVMIQAGITKVFFVDKGTFSSEHWNKPVEIGNEMFKEAGVELVGIPLEEFEAFLATQENPDGLPAAGRTA